MTTNNIFLIPIENLDDMTTNNIFPIPLENLDEALKSEIAGERCEAFMAPDANGAVQIAFFPDIDRAGLVYVGAGSNGETFWTDAASPSEALRRYLTDDLRP